MTNSASHRKLARAAFATCAIWGMISQSPTWADTTWTGSGSTSEFGDGGNWDTGAPDASDLAIFGNVGSTPQLPTFNAIAPGDSVLGLRIDNTGIDWSMVKNVVTANDRGLTIGSGGIVVQGGGTAAVAPNVLRLGADQDWVIGLNTTLTLDGGGTIKAPISGAFKITKKGAGTLHLTTNSGGAFATAWSGGLDIVAGTVHNAFSTSGAGTGPVSVRNGATYMTSANNAGATVTFFDGSTLKGSGGNGGITGSGTIAVDAAASNIYVTTTGTTGDIIQINASNPFTGGNANTVVNFSGPNNTTIVMNGAGSGFLGSGLLTSGRMRMNNSSAGFFGGRPLTMQSGTTLSLGTLGATSGNTITNAFTASGDITIEADRPSSSASPPSSSFDFSGGLIISGNRTVNLTRGANITAGSPNVKFVTNGIKLGGNLNLNQPAEVISSASSITNVTGDTNTYSFTKTGAGTFTLGGGSNYTGKTTIAGGTLNLSSNNTSFGASNEVAANSGTTLWLNTGAGFASWTTPAALKKLTGDGIVKVETGNGNATLTLSGDKTITPGDNGLGGSLEIQGRLSIQSSGGVFPKLVINVTDSPSGAVAGLLQVNFALQGTTTSNSGLNNLDLEVNFAPGLTMDDFGPGGLTIVTAGANLLATSLFHNDATFQANGGDADIEYGAGIVKLVNIAVPEPGALSLLAIASLSCMTRRRRGA